MRCLPIVLAVSACGNQFTLGLAQRRSFSSLPANKMLASRGLFVRVVKPVRPRLASSRYFSKDVVPGDVDKPQKRPEPAPLPSALEHKMFSAAYFADVAFKNQVGLLLAGSVVGVVGISNLLYTVGDHFMNLTSSSALYYGFSVGAIATTCTAAGAYIVEKSFRIEPESAVRLAMAEVRKNKDLANILGPKITPGDVKTYTLSSSGFGIIGTVPKLIHPKIHLVFPLAGSTSPAVVSAVCTKKGLFKHQCEYVGVDWTTPAGATLSLTLLGEEATFSQKNAVRDHAKLLTSKSPKYR